MALVSRQADDPGYSLRMPSTHGPLQSVTGRSMSLPFQLSFQERDSGLFMGMLREKQVSTLPQLQPVNARCGSVGSEVAIRTSYRQPGTAHALRGQHPSGPYVHRFHSTTTLKPIASITGSAKDGGMRQWQRW